MELPDSLNARCIDTAQTLTGSARRVLMARTVKARGTAGQRRAERELGGSRVTMRPGSGALARRADPGQRLRAWRNRAEAHLPTLLVDLHALGESQSQTDPQFRSARLYPRLSGAEVRRQLIAQKGSTAAELPTVAPIRTNLDAVGSAPKQGAKTHPQNTFRKPPRSSRK